MRLRRVETLVVVREPELSALEKKVLELLPEGLGQLAVGDHDVVSDGDLVVDSDDQGVVDADHAGADDGLVGRSDHGELLAGRLESLGAGAPASTLVDLRAELMIQGRLR